MAMTQRQIAERIATLTREVDQPFPGIYDWDRLLTLIAEIHDITPAMIARASAKQAEERAKKAKDE